MGSLTFYLTWYKIKKDTQIISKGYLIIKGSISKFIHGSNLSSVSRYEIKEAFKEISSLLGINLLNSDVTRLHIAENVLLKHPTYQYLMSITAFPRLKRETIYNPSFSSLKRRNKSCETILFLNKNEKKGIMFYNKIKELRDTRKLSALISHFDILKSSILRIEVKVNSKPYKTIFNRKQIILSDLLKKKNYVVLIDYWKQECDKIYYDKVCKDNYKIKTKKDFEKWLQIMAVKELGMDHVFQKLDDSLIEHKSNFRKYIREQLQTPKSIEETDELYLELKEAMELVYNYHI